MKIEISTAKNTLIVSLEDKDKGRKDTEVLYDVARGLADAVEETVLTLFPDAESIEEEQRWSELIYEISQGILNTKYYQVKKEIEKLKENESLYKKIMENTFTDFKKRKDLNDEDILRFFSVYQPEDLYFTSVCDEENDCIKVGIINRNDKEFLLVIDNLVLSDEAKTENGSDRAHAAAAVGAMILRLVDESNGKVIFRKTPFRKIYQEVKEE